MRVKQRSEKSSGWKITGAFIVFALSHSLFASQEFKQAVQKKIGTNGRNGLYRFGFNAISVITVFPAAIWFLKLPDRRLYRIRRPWSWALISIQGAALLLAVEAARRVGLKKITGIQPAEQFVDGKTPEPEPTAQGPVLLPDETMDANGPFRFSRHPLNLAPLGIFWFFPHMTVNRLVLALLSTVYLFVGSLHEEKRLRASYGEAYRRYQHSGVPFFFPIGKRK